MFNTISISHDVRVVCRSTTDATSEAGTVYTSGTAEFTPSFQFGSFCAIFSFLCSVLYIIVCLFVFFIWPLYCLSFRFTGPGNLFCFSNFFFHLKIYIPPKMKMWFVLDLSDIFWRIRNDINHRYRPRTKRISAFVFDTVQDVDIYERRRNRRLTILQYSPLITVYMWVNHLLQFTRGSTDREITVVMNYPSFILKHFG